MTASDILDLHDGAVQSLARRYREEGYDVVVQPERDELPAALQPFRPDILARRGSEGVIAEVKRRRPASRQHWPEVAQMAAAARTMPGWRFELVVVDGAAEGPESAARDWSFDEIEHALSEVGQLLRESRTTPALLLLFAALEPLLRAVAAAEDVFVPGFGISPLISALTSEGVISRKDYHDLMDGLQVRNAIAHGLRPQTPPSRTAIRRLLTIARRLGQAAKIIRP